MSPFTTYGSGLEDGGSQKWEGVSWCPEEAHKGRGFSAIAFEANFICFPNWFEMLTPSILQSILLLTFSFQSSGTKDLAPDCYRSARNPVD